MTCGIYRLIFKGLDKYYIGQSIHIEDRYKEHLRNLKSNNGKSNYKVYNAYLKYGEPTLEILCECTYEDLNKYEEEAFEIFKASSHGLNISNKANSGGVLGSDNVLARYSNETYEKIFHMLVNSTFSIKTIAVECDVTEDTVTDISRGKSHVRSLYSKYPVEYTKYMSSRRTQSMGKFSNSNTVSLISPNGDIIEVGNTISNFCKEYNLDPINIGRVISGSRLSHKKWRLHKG
jgi:group I intron endonuclease